MRIEAMRKGFFMKRALICGISGQDGSYLARFLLNKGYEVYGTSRDVHAANFTNLVKVEIFESVQLESMAINDFRSVLQVLMKVRPDEVYNLAGLTSVSLSFQQPVETIESNLMGTLTLLEAIRFSGAKIKFYNACSSECFGDTPIDAASEETPFRPRSPYAISKAAAYWQVVNYREAYGLFACSGILFNHESPLRPERFVTKKIISAVSRIAQGSKEHLYLGNLAIQRDWGWAPDYVEAMWLMLQHNQPDDFIVATGKSHSLFEFVKIAFEYVGLEWEKYVSHDEKLIRPTDIAISKADPKKVKEKLAWTATHDMKDVIVKMIQSESLHNYF
jgi:GDPmannose 4,6-dehydratase